MSHAPQPRKAAPAGSGPLGSRRTVVSLAVDGRRVRERDLNFNRLRRLMTAAPAGDLLSKLKLPCVEAALVNADLTAFQARAVATMIMRYVDRKHFARTGEMIAYPSQQTLALECGGTVDGVRKALLQAARLGLLEIKSGGGRGMNSRYRIIPVPAPPYPERQTAVWPFDAEPQTAVRENPRLPSEKPQTDPATNPLKKSLSESLSAGEPARASVPKRQPEKQIPDGFPGAPDLALAEGWVDAAQVELSVGQQAKRFRNHAATKDRRERNWPAAWRQWIDIEIERLPPAKAKAVARTMPTWNGPQEVMAAVAAGMSEAGARSYLARCTWQDVPDRAVVAPHDFAAEKITEAAGRTFAAMGIRVIVREPERVA